jgi:two-component system, cell cycle sensor histidine kinase and response regulator CckA
MPYVYSYLHFFSAMLFFSLGVIIIIRDVHSRLNQTCAGIMFCFFIWSFCTVWVHHPATSEGVARIFGNIAAVGWLFYNTFHLWFAWLYTKRKPFPFQKLIATFFFFLPAMLLLLQWKDSIFIADFQSCSYGWFTPWEPNLWSQFFFFYLALMTLTAFWLIFDYGRKSENFCIRRQSRIIIITGLVSLLSGFLCNIVFSLFIPEGFPSIGDITSLLWAGGLAYVAIRYNMLNITPFIAANRIIATMKDLLFLLDTHGLVISVNNAAQEVLGYQTDRITACYFSELIDEHEERQNALLNTMLQQSVYTVETALSCSSGTSVPVELSTSLIPGTGIVCVAHDISLQRQRTESLTEAKKRLESRVMQATEKLRQTNSRLLKEVGEKNVAVKALKESEERFRIIFEYAPDGICLIDHDGNFIDGNNEALRIIGYSKHDLAGKNLFGSELLSPEDTGKKAAMISTGDGETGSLYRELKLTRADGDEIPVETSSHQLIIGEKHLNVCIIRDLTQRKEAEKEAEGLRDALHHSQKMDAVGRLAGGIAHDFNNLLGGIIGYAGLLRKRLRSEFPSESGILEKIINVSKQAAERTAQLLAFARKGKYNVTPVDIHTVINEVISLMRHTIDPKIIISGQCDAECAIVNGDRSQLHSALLNLGVNARDALPDGGAISFSTENVPGSKVQCTDTSQDTIAENYLKIVVKDNGTGMDDATVSRAFEPFFSTKEEGKGTGLGLPSVYGTVKQHGGQICIESEREKGTMFTLFLPIAEGEERPVFEEVRVLSTEMHHDSTVLVVDDTPLIREMMVETLIDIGYIVHSCEDGATALSWYGVHHTSCDLVILDYRMHEMNGKECYTAMKKIDPTVRAIITSGHAVNGEIEKLLEAGVCSFLQKPFDVDDLAAMVHDVLSDG